MRCAERIANTSETDWPAWNRIGLGFHRASDGSKAGFEAFNAYSARNTEKYDEQHTRARWDHYRKAPASRIGPGTLYAALARLEARGLIEALEPEDRRRPYRLTGLGATTLRAQLEGLEGFARTGLRRLEGRPSA